MLARDIASLDLVSGGRSVLCFAPPFDEGLAEAAALCRALWRAGEVVSDGPQFPVRAAANRARPARDRSPLVAFDLTAADELPASAGETGDLVLRPGADTPPAGWSGCDGRHVVRERASHQWRRRPLSPAGISPPSTGCAASPSSAWWRTTCSSAGPRAGTSASTSSSSSPAS